MIWIGGLGLVLLAAAVFVSVVSAALVTPRVVRVARLGRDTSRLAAEAAALVASSRESLVASASERERLMRPYTRVRRWLTHPLTVALIESYARRRERAREAAAAS